MVVEGEEIRGCEEKWKSKSIRIERGEVGRDGLTQVVTEQAEKLRMQRMRTLEVYGYGREAGDGRRGCPQSAWRRDLVAARLIAGSISQPA